MKKNSVRMLAAAALAALGSMTTMGLACSQTTPCEVEGGNYYIALPDGADGPVPAFVFIHGFGGSGAGVFRNTGLVDAVLARGYAFVAPAGMKMEDRQGASWSFHPDRPERRDEVAFITKVRDDLMADKGVDPDHVILGGFSIGGSMTSYLACEAPDTFSAYVPLGGSFWRPHPDTCAGPVRLLHTHGWTDGTVPLEGRQVGSGFVQGDVFHAMSVWRQANGCDNLKADRFAQDARYWHRIWDRCDEGSALQLSLFFGGHIIPPGWADHVLDWYEAL